MKKLIITFVLLLCSSVSFAGDFTLHTSLGSYHTEKYQGNEFKEWNQRNEGFSIEWNQTKELSYQIGSYHNSEWKNSKFAFVQYLPIEYKGASVGAFGGYVSGYELTNIAAGLMLRYKVEKVVFTTRYVPKVDKRLGSSVFGFEVGYNF